MTEQHREFEVMLPQPGEARVRLLYLAPFLRRSRALDGADKPNGRAEDRRPFGTLPNARETASEVV
jgi:hypothetical protein